MPNVSQNPSVIVSGDMELIHPGDLIGKFVVEATDTNLQISDVLDTSQGAHFLIGVNGIGLTYSNGQLVGGTVTHLVYDVSLPGQFISFSAETPHFSAPLLATWVATNDANGALSTILAGNDTIVGSSPGSLTVSGADVIRAYGGNDVIFGNGGPDSLYGGAGDDIILANAQTHSGPNYLRGEDGNDFIVGGDGFNDINGNQGNDTIVGNVSDDWVVGGKDDDLQFGGGGSDIVWGNLGNDTLEGGAGDDQIRGGQGDDILFGDAGNDYVSGDRGNDTEVGGAGADIFHSFSGAGIDRVLDFHVSEGDRVMLDPGTTFNVSQVGADTVVDMGNGDQLILVGVQASSLPPGTIFLG